ncbi:MAG: tetratricopeptide repeat protein [Candidatus Omnitrophica bacterium]|nr:tetratricopeptide repeat protein [Candidatus Omnitrophota bacterium]
MKSKCCKIVLFLSLIMYMFMLHIASSQEHPEMERAKRRLMELNAQIQEMGKLQQHHSVEKAMDSMIELMIQLNFPEEIITERAHLRLRYSQSVGRLESARTAALSWLEAHPNDFKILEIYGLIALRMDRNDEALKAFRTLYQSDPNDRKYQFRYLNILNRLQDRETALQVIEQIEKTPCENPSLLREAAASYLLFENPQKANEILDRLEAIDPTHAYIPYARGEVLFKQENYDESISFLSKVSQTDEQWADAQQMIGLCYLKLRRFDQASQIFIDILSRFPYDSKTMSLLEQALARQRKTRGFKQVRQIRQNIEKVVMPDIEAGYLWRNGDVVEHARLRSISLNQIGHFREAENLLIQASETIPDSTSAFLNLARFYIVTHQACRAEPILQNLLKNTNSTDKPIFIVELAEAYLRQGKTNETAALLNREAETESLKRMLHTMIGTAFLEITGDAESSINYLEQNQSPDEQVAAALARAYMEIDDASQALKFFERMPEDFDDIKTQLAKVECLAKLDMAEQANTIYEGIRNKNPALSEMLTAAAESALAPANRPEDRSESTLRAKRIKTAMRQIRKNVRDAHCQGWPQSIPVLLELSDLYAKLHENEIALEYAQLAFEGDQTRIELREKLIELMTSPMQVFQRLSQIRLLESNPSIQKDFKNEREEALSHIQLSSAK